MNAQLSLLGRSVRVRPTSMEARRSIRSEDITRVQAAIMSELRIAGPLSDEDLADRLHGAASPSGLRTRRAELVAAGKIRDSGKRGKTASGRSCIVWELVK